jgi:hypothetical protein
MSFNLTINWRGGFGAMTRREDTLRYNGQSRSLGTRENIVVPFSPNVPLPRMAPVFKHVPDPFVLDGDYLQVGQDAGRVVGQDSTTVAHGRGQLTWFDVVIYDGQFSDGWKDGLGVGLIFVAQSVSNEKIFTQNRPAYNGVYEGVWRYGCRHGYGTQVFVDGTTYRGSWINDAPNGVGQVVYADGSVLTGTFAGEHTKPIGACVLKCADGVNEVHFYSSPGKLDSVRATTNAGAAEKALLDKLKAMEAGAQPYVPCMGARAIPSVGQGGAAAGSAAPYVSASVAGAAAGGGGGGGAAAAAAPMMMAAPVSSAAEPPSLKLKRVLKDFIANDAPAWESRVAKEAGVQVALQIASESFTEHAAAGGTAINAIVDPVTTLHPLLSALKQVAADPMGKESIGGSLVAFKVVNSEAARAAELKYDGGKKTIIVSMPFIKGLGCKGMLTQQAVVECIMKNC